MSSLVPFQAVEPSRSTRTPRRILFLTGSYPPVKCGVGDYVAAVAEYLAQIETVSIGVLTIGEGERSSRAGTGVERLAPEPDWSLHRLQRFARKVDEWKPDIVHFHFPTITYGRKLLPTLLPLWLHLRGHCTVQTWHDTLNWKVHLRLLPCAVIPDALIYVRPGYLETGLAKWYRILVDRKLTRYIPSAPTIPRVALSPESRHSVRARTAPPGRNLIAYFGFAVPRKGIHDLFAIADPGRDHLVLMCELAADDPYQARILELSGDARWRGRVTVTGYLDAPAVGTLLAAVDAAVFPFAEPAGSFHTSVTAAQAAGCFVLTTDDAGAGYDETSNTYYARVGDIDAMRRALRKFVGTRSTLPVGVPTWKTVADAHMEVYRDALSRTSMRARDERKPY